MPRKAPNEVIEHRMTLGDWERKEIKEITDQVKRVAYTASIVSGTGAVLATGAVVGSTYLIYLALKEMYGFVDEVTEPLKEIIFGKKTYPTKDPPPANPDDWVNRDSETGERINPVSNVPIMGGLVGLGIKAGEAVPVGSWIAGIFD